MSSSTNSASMRIESLLDEKSFVEIGAKVTARSTDFDLKQNDMTDHGFSSPFSSSLISASISSFTGSTGFLG